MGMRINAWVSAISVARRAATAPRILLDLSSIPRTLAPRPGPFNAKSGDGAADFALYSGANRVESRHSYLHSVNVINIEDADGQF